MKLLGQPASRWLKRSCSATFDLLIPPRCLSCAADLAGPGEEVMLCGDCREKLTLINWPVCPRCAAPVPSAEGVTLACNYCRGDKLYFERAIALGSYDGLLRQLIMRMKTDRSGLVAQTLVRLAWRELHTQLSDLKVDVVAAVPMHPWRRWRRGINPPVSMANWLADRLAIPAAAGMLGLLRNIPPQVGLSRPARFRNVQGEMVVRPTYHLQSAHVLLVDDILTNGATCSEAARALRRAGAREVSVFALARTPAD